MPRTMKKAKTHANAKPRNAQDATLRNTRAANKKIRDLEARVVELEHIIRQQQ